MPKGPAKLGYFVSKDKTIQNADNVCVLVVHYNFEKTKNETWIRIGDDQDVNNLKRTFEEKRNCNFHDVLSPEKEELLELLSDQEKLLRLFGSSDVPSVFVLYILSHGDTDGKIFTDHFTDDVPASAEERARSRDPKELFVSFTTTEIFESLKMLTNFEECLKFINFGPCRGELDDVLFSEIDEEIPYNNKNSCRITYSPLTRNTVVFFSTVETTRAKRNQSGSTFASLTCHVFNFLEKDESFINVLTTIQNESHKNVDFKKSVGQTPEVKMFSQDRGFVISKSPSNCSASSTSDGIGIMMKKELEFYSWKSNKKENLRRRLAILFSEEHNDRLKEIKKVLSLNLDFDTSERMLRGKPWMSINEASWSDSDIGCIFLIFFGRLSENKVTNEVCVQVDGQETAVSEILREFIGPKNEQWIGKPKILFLVNQETSSFDYIGSTQPKMKISATNHSGWLVLVLHNKDELQKLIELFKGQELKKEKTLQELLASLLISESKDNKDLLNSTLQYPLNFPDWPKSFVELSFSVTKSQYGEEKYDCLDSLVKQSATKKRIWLLSSVAGTGKTTILREMAFQLGKLNPELLILRVSLPRFSFSSLDRNVTEIEFLVKATQNLKEEIIKSIEKKQCVVILDGFDEITRPDNQEKTLKVIEALEKKQISVWIGTRSNAAEAIQKRISNAVLVKIDPLDEEQQIEFLKMETGKSREESEQFIENFKSKDILRNPLHLSLVARYGAEGNLYQIYHKVLRHKVEDSLIRNGYDKNNYVKFKEELDYAMADLQKLASCHIRGVELTDYTKDDLDKNNYYGIASFQNNKVIFIHQTFAEFLAAQYFLREIENCGDCDVQTSTEDIADLFLGKSFSWCRKFVDLFYSTVLNDVEKIEKRRESILRVMKLKPDIFLGLIASDGCINIFKMVYPIITFSEKQEGNRITVAKDRTLLFKAIEGAEEIAIMLLDIDLIESDEELLIILPHLLNLVAGTNACLFFEKLETKFPTLPEMIHSRRSILEAGVLAARNDHGEILHLLLQNGVDKYFQDDEEGNALYCAFCNGAIKCVEVLLKHGAKLAIDEDGESSDPLMMAVEVNELDLVKFLLEENISGLQRNKETFEINEVKSYLNAFHSAIKKGHKEIAKLLIEKCPSLKNAEYGDDESLLQIAAKNEYLDLCQMLVDEEGVDVNTLRPSGDPRDWSRNDNKYMDYFLILQKSDINMTDERGKTALHCAAEYGYLERVKELVNSGTNIRAVDENGWNAFHFACSSRRYLKGDVIQLLHSTDSQLAKEKTGSGQTGLHILVEMSSVWLVRFLVEEIGVDVRAKDNNGRTALRIAINEAKDCVDFLMTKDINLDFKNKGGQTCLHAAAKRGDLEALQTWIELGGDFNVVDDEGSTALHIAAESGHLQFVKKFLVCATEEVKNQDIGEGCVGSKLKGRVNRCNKFGRTALHLAAESGNVDLVEWLLKNNADLTLTDWEGKNAIHHAIRDEKMLRFINEKNGDLLKQRTNYGNTTLHLAMVHYPLNETEDIALWIIEQLDDTVLNAKNASGDTLLLMACERRWWRVAELLLSRDVKVNVFDICGKTAMDYAAENGNLDFMRLLLKRGADWTLTDWNGMSALHHAAKEGNLSLVEVLHEKGADLTLTDNEGMNALHHAINNLEVISFFHEKNNELLGQRLKNGDTTLHLALKTWRIDTDTILWLVEQCENDLNLTNNEGETPLLLACKVKEWIIAKILVSKSVDIHVKDTNGITALQYAVSLFRRYRIEDSYAFDLVQELCKKGADLALTDNEGKNAFHHAITNFHMALFIHKLNGNLVNQRCNNGDTTLHLAIKLDEFYNKKKDNILPWLVEQCENDLNVKNNEGETPLLLACKREEWIIAKILLAKTVDINARDKNGRTALHYAIKLKDDEPDDDSDSESDDEKSEFVTFDLVQELCKRGADLEFTDYDGMNSFHHAITNFHMALLIHKLNGNLVKQRCNDGDTSLQLAIKLDEDDRDDNILPWLVEQCESDLNVKNNEGETPLLLACKNGMWIIAKILLAKTVDINARDKNGRTALHYAVKFYAFERLENSPAFDLLKELCKRGADLALTDNDGMNAFHHAMEKFNMALYIHGLNGNLVKQRLNNGDTSLHLAIKLFRNRPWRYDSEILMWLVEQGVIDLNAKNALNETPLILACKKRLWNNKFFEKLLSKNVDVNVKDIEGKSARDYIDEFCPTHILRRFDELEEADTWLKMRMS